LRLGNGGKKRGQAAMENSGDVLHELLNRPPRVHLTQIARCFGTNRPTAGHDYQSWVRPACQEANRIRLSHYALFLFIRGVGNDRYFHSDISPDRGYGERDRSPFPSGTLWLVGQAVSASGRT
jgi:hypothetical protein